MTAVSETEGDISIITIRYSSITVTILYKGLIMSRMDTLRKWKK